MSEIRKIFEEIGKKITKDTAKQINSIYLFKIGNDVSENWVIDLTKESNWITPISEEALAELSAHCIVSILNSDDWIALAKRKLNPTTAFVQGRIKIKGDVSLALKLNKLFF